MLRSPLPLLFLATASVALFACSSDTTTSSTSTTGGGGSEGTTTATSTGAGGASTTSTSTGTSTGTGMAVMNACTNDADKAIVAAKDVKAITTKCGQDNLGAEPATKSCIIINTGLTDNCAGCYSGEVDCVSDHCIGAEGKCLLDPAAQMCLDCRAKYCAKPFETCSGTKSMP